jgi:hypothetical protein
VIDYRGAFVRGVTIVIMHFALLCGAVSCTMHFSKWCFLARKAQGRRQACQVVRAQAQHSCIGESKTEYRLC